MSLLSYCNSSAFIRPEFDFNIRCILIFFYMVARIFLDHQFSENLQYYIDGLVEERYNYIANALELHLPCSNLSIWSGQLFGRILVMSPLGGKDIVKK